MGQIKICSLKNNMWLDLVGVFYYNLNANNPNLMESKIGNIDVTIEIEDFKIFLEVPHYYRKFV